MPPGGGTMGENRRDSPLRRGRGRQAPGWVVTSGTIHPSCIATAPRRGISRGSSMGCVALTIVFLSSLQTAVLASAEGPAQDRLQQAAQLISEQKFGAAQEILEALLSSAGEH